MRRWRNSPSSLLPSAGNVCWQKTLHLTVLNSRQPVTLGYCLQLYILVLNYFLRMLFLNSRTPWRRRKPLELSFSLAVIAAATKGCLGAGVRILGCSHPDGPRALLPRGAAGPGWPEAGSRAVGVPWANQGALAGVGGANALVSSLSAVGCRRASPPQNLAPGSLSTSPGQPHPPRQGPLNCVIPPPQ